MIAAIVAYVRLSDFLKSNLLLSFFDCLILFLIKASYRNSPAKMP